MRDLHSNGLIWTSKRCLIYARCSKDDQDASVPDQLRTIDRERKTFELEPVTAPFVDDGLKGHDESRPGLRAVIDYARAHPNPVRRNADFIPILVYDVSRFGRFDDPKKIFAYFVEVERFGFEFYSITERIRSRGNIADFVQLIIKGEQAYDYSVTLSKYAMRTACQLAQKGWWPGGMAPYGYDRMTFGPDGKPKYRYVASPDKTVKKYSTDGKLIEVFQPIEDRGRRRSAYSDKLKGDRVRLVPGARDRVETVQFIYESFAEKRKGLKWIAHALNQKGVAPPKGPYWIPITIRAFLRNPAYKGALVYGRRSDGKHHWLEIERTEEGFEAKIERKDVPGRVFVHRSISECIVVEEGHEPIVPPELWEKVQERLRLQKKTFGHADGHSGRAANSSYLLSGDGLMKCRRCGYSFQGKTDPRNRLRYYYDSGYERGGVKVCRCTYVPADGFESWVLEGIRRRLLGDSEESVGSLKRLEEEVFDRLRLNGFAEGAKNEARDCESRIEAKRKKVKLLVANLDEETLGVVKDELRSLNQEIRNLEEELTRLRLRKAYTPATDPRDRAHKIASRIFDFKHVLENGTTDELKTLVRCFVDKIEVDPDRGVVEVEFFAPPPGVDERDFFWDWSPQRVLNQSPHIVAR